MNKHTLLSCLGSSLLIAAPASQALEINADDWTLSFGGYINTHLVYAKCDDNAPTVAGNALLCTGEDASAVSNGYSPASFQLSASTQRNGFDIRATVAIEPGTTDNAAFNGNGDGEAWRAFFTVGNDEVGTLTVGRAYGVYGIDVLVEDMSLASVGAPLAVESPLNTSLGGAGYGYIFADRLSQITYDYKASNGVSTAIGLYQPLDLVSFGGNGYVGDTGSQEPGLHGKLRFDHQWGFVSTTFLRQSVDVANGNDYEALAVDLTAAISLGNTRLMASAFDATGVGYYGLFIDAADINGDARDTQGWFVQLSHQIGDTKLGINYGESSVELAPADTDTQLNTQAKLTLGVYHTLLPGLVLAGEYSELTADNHRSEEMENQAVSVGLALSF
jgi:predicted porin